jgi:hypothetical protein
MTHPHRRNRTGRVPPSHAPARHHPRLLYNAFSFGLFAAYELESEDRELLQKLISEWRSQYRRPNDARLIESDEELIDEYYGTKEPDVIQ